MSIILLKSVFSDMLEFSNNVYDSKTFPMIPSVVSKIIFYPP